MTGKIPSLASKYSANLITRPTRTFSRCSALIGQQSTQPLRALQICSYQRGGSDSRFLLPSIISTTSSALETHAPSALYAVHASLRTPLHILECPQLASVRRWAATNLSESSNSRVNLDLACLLATPPPRTSEEQTDTKKGCGTLRDVYTSWQRTIYSKALLPMT